MEETLPSLRQDEISKSKLVDSTGGIFSILNQKSNVNFEMKVKVSTEIENAGSYLKPWFDFCYYVFFIPFKIKTNGKVFVASNNPTRKIICGFIHIMGLADEFFEIRGTLVKTIQADPGIFLRLIERMNAACHSYIFYLIWFRRSDLLTLFGDPKVNKDASGHVRRNGFIFVLLVYCFSAFAYISEYFSHNLSKSYIDKGFTKKVEQFRFEYFLTPSASLSPEEKAITLFIRIGTVACMFVRIYKWILLDLLMCLCMITGFASYKLTKAFNDLVQHSGTSETELSNIFDAYYKIKEKLDTFNDLLGPLFVVIFFSMITFCAVRTVDVLDSKEWNYRFIMGVYFICFASVLVLSAESHYQVSHFKNWLLARSKKSVSDMMNYLEVDSTNLAIKGGRLFTITYGFIGTASSVALTYAIIMIQFRGCCSAQ